MNDQELLTYAAKAAGIEYKHATSAGLYLGESEDNFWSPLNSDADAFQLMCKLKIDLYFGNGDVETSVTPKKGYFEEVFLDFYADEQSKMIAARRVIVMVAAEIGKGIHQSQKTEGLPEDNYYKTQAESEIGKGM